MILNVTMDNEEVYTARTLIIHVLKLQMSICSDYMLLATELLHKLTSCLYTYRDVITCCNLVNMSLRKEYTIFPRKH